MTDPNFTPSAPDAFEAAVQAAAPSPEQPRQHGGARPGAGRKPRSGSRARTTTAPSSAPQPPAQPAAPVPPLSPELREYYSTMLMRFDNMLLGDVKPPVPALSRTEAEQGAEALHPLIHAYGEKLLDPRVQFALWAGTAYVPRLVEFARGYSSQRKARQLEAESQPGAAKEAPRGQPFPSADSPPPKRVARKRAPGDDIIVAPDK